MMISAGGGPMMVFVMMINGSGSIYGSCDDGGVGVGVGSGVSDDDN